MENTSLIFKPVDFLTRDFSSLYKSFFEFSTGNHQKNYFNFGAFIYVEVTRRW